MSPAISIRKLAKTYASGFQAINGVDLDIRYGEIVAAPGSSGANKFWQSRVRR